MPAPLAITAPGVPRAASTRAADQLAATSASRGPCRAAPCPSPRRRRGRATRDAGGRRCVASQSIAASSHGSLLGQRIGDDVRRRERDAVPAGARHARPRGDGLAARGSSEAASRSGRRCGQVDARHRCASLQLSAGTSIQRRSRQLRRPSSASCTPLAPSQQVPAERRRRRRRAGGTAPTATLKPLS